MITSIKNRVGKVGALRTNELEELLIDTYRLLDSESGNDYNICLSVICHVANISPADAMVQQLLHDCIVKSRVFLYDILLSKSTEGYQPQVSVQDRILQSVYTSNATNTTLTKPQKEIFDLFQRKRRLIVSAPTSFGKTRIIREIIAHNRYKNIALIMPTVSLLSEQYHDIKSSVGGYVITKSSKIKVDKKKRYIFILTPERMSSFLEDNPDFVFDFFVMDEIYKVDYKLDDDRFRVFSDVLYRLANTPADFYLIGPYISDFSTRFRERFDVAIKKYDVEIVQKDFYNLDNEDNRGSRVIEGKSVRIIKDRFENLLRLMSEDAIDGKFLVYRQMKKSVEETAGKLIDIWPVTDHNKDLVAYLSETVSEEWDLVSCIKRGVAFHHGAMPRHIQDLIVDEFNKPSGGVDYLFCTTSLTEGVNSAAKNVVIYDRKVGNNRPLSTLDRKNIEGRAGRFMQHFIGRVFYLEAPQHQDSETVVELEGFDGDSPSVETLIQLNPNDIPKSSMRRYKDHLRLLEGASIPPEIVSRNRFVSISGQIELIRRLRGSGALEGFFFDGQLPSKACLDSTLSIIYDLLFASGDIGRDFEGEIGKSRLINLTKYYVYFTPSFKMLLGHKVINEQRSTPNARIRYVFDLVSKYFEFVWPKYLKAFERLYNFVADEKGQEAIDLSLLIAKLEYGTAEAHEIILRDFGLPNDIVKKISKLFVQCEGADEVLSRRHRVDDKIRALLRPIELKVLNRYM